MTNKENCWSEKVNYFRERHSVNNLNGLNYTFNDTTGNKPWR
jgi:hypothetical protein